MALAAGQGYLGPTVTQSHVYAVASGFSLRVIPVAAPYEFALGPESGQLDIWRDTSQGRLFARLTPDGGGYASKIASGTKSLADVVDVVRGPDVHSWWIETSVYKLVLPVSWRAVVNGDAAVPSMFDLLGPNGGMMFVQTPRVTPTPEQLCAPGQRIHSRGSDSGSTWIELRYSHEDSTWTQRHDILRVGPVSCILTVQSLAGAFASIADAHRSVLRSIMPGGSPDT